MYQVVRFVRIVAPLLALASCTSSPITASDDGGGLEGGSATDAVVMDAPRADDLVTTCASVQESVTQYFADHSMCKFDSECTNAMTACGLDGNCGAYLESTGLLGLSRLVTQWTNLSCGAAIRCAACPATPPPPAACNGGHCGKALPGRVGDPCTDDNTCMTPTCERSAPFTGGYCTSVQPDCTVNQACPFGSVCREVKVGAQPTDLCLKSCQTPDDCRRGYTCCDAWKPGPPGRACYPGINCPM